MRFLFLNQYGPPDPAPTARLLGELAKYLRAQGHGVEIVAQSQTYQGRPARGGSRLVREVGALFAIARLGFRARDSKPDVILALSSPPGLLIVAALLALRHGAVLAHWAMDLYPELALALGEIRAGVVSRAASWLMGWAYRRTPLLLALDEDMQTHLQRTYGVESKVLAPWLSAPAAEQVSVSIANPVVAVSPWVWLYSGNLGRAHEWETLLAVQRCLEDRELPIQLVFQGDGAARGAAERRAGDLGLKRCWWQPYVAEDELVEALLAARLLLATQRCETRGLLWPSKLALLEQLPRPILWVGPTDGAIARRLRERGGAGVFAPGAVETIASWIETRYRHPEEEFVLKAASRTGQAGCAQLERWFFEVVENRFRTL